MNIRKSLDEIDLETMIFTVEENGTYTIYALNADGVTALSTITISNITDPDGKDKIKIEEIDSGGDKDSDTTTKEGSDKDGETLPETAIMNLFNLLVIGKGDINT